MVRGAAQSARRWRSATLASVLLPASLAALAWSAACPGPALARAQTTQPSAARWQTPLVDDSAHGRLLLPVPFVAQEPLLCGPATIEMALRHAGVRGMLASDFAALVRPDEGGIRTGELAQAVRELGWKVDAGPADPTTLVSHLTAGRPVTVLLAEGADRYHYVLVVGRTANGVVVHDPGRAPGLLLPLDDFLGRWEAAGRFALTVLGRTAAVSGEDRNGPPASRDGLNDAGQGHVAQHETRPPHPLLVRASDLFRASRWREAADAAYAASRSDPVDPRVWPLLASSRYLAGDPQGALEAWSRTEPPRVDRVSVHGLRRTHHPVVHALLGIRPGQPLRARDLERARRRLGLLPSADATSVSYRALPGGLADVEATALERTLLPRTPVALAGMLLPALAVSEVDLPLQGAMHAGESLTLSFRWSAARRAAGLSLAVPGAPPTGGVARLEAGLERERHRAEAGDRVSAETRARARLILTDWANGWLRWEVGGGAERWRGPEQWYPASAALSAAIELSPAGRRAGLLASVEGVEGSRGGPSYLRWTVRGTGQLLPRASPWGVRVRTLAAGAVGNAPRMAWPGAGTGRARDGLLRAHALERDGALGGPAFGTLLLNASVELERVLVTLPAARLGATTFADAARITGTTGPAPQARPHLLDIGAGLWLDLPGGRLQLSAAAGTDGAECLSLTWRREP